MLASVWNFFNMETIYFFPLEIRVLKALGDALSDNEILAEV